MILYDSQLARCCQANTTFLTDMLNHNAIIDMFCCCSVPSFLFLLNGCLFLFIQWLEKSF